MGYILQLFLRLLQILPLRVHYVLGDFVAWLAEKVFHYRVHDVTVNLARSFPELKYEELKELKHLFYRHFGELMAESVWFGGCRNAKRLRNARLVEIENSDELKSLYEKAPSVMVLMTHSGNWELIGGILNYDYSHDESFFTQDDFFVVYRLQSVKFWNRILKENRTAPLPDRKNYRGYLESGKAVRFVFEHRDEKIIYNFITDQYPYAEASGYLRLNFMHQSCVTMKGAAELARKLGMAVCYMSMPQERRGKYKIKYTTICEDASKTSPEEIVKQYYKLLEADIEALPWNYLWSHRRWKDETGDKPIKTI